MKDLKDFLLESIADTDDQISTRNERYLDMLGAIDQVIEVIFKYFKPFYSGCYKDSDNLLVFEFMKFRDMDEILEVINKAKHEVKHNLRTRFTGVDIIDPHNPKRNISFWDLERNDYYLDIMIDDFKENYLNISLNECSTKSRNNRVIAHPLIYNSSSREICEYFCEHLKSRLRKRK